MNGVRVILRATPGRMARWGDYLRAALPPHTEFLVDTEGRGAMVQFLTSLRMAENAPLLMLEDDIQVTRNFWGKVCSALATHGGSPIQFFSRSKDDRTLGSRWRPGSTFSMNQCHYFPPGMSSALADYYPFWPDRLRHPTGYDLLMGSYFKDYGVRYWQHVPSLVQHREGPSEINASRPRLRQSPTFTDPIPDTHDKPPACAARAAKDGEIAALRVFVQSKDDVSLDDKVSTTYWYVATTGTTIIGCYGLMETGVRKLRFRGWFVHPEHRARGVGYGLLQHAIHTAHRLGADTMDTFTAQHGAMARVGAKIQGDMQKSGRGHYRVF